MPRIHQVILLLAIIVTACSLMVQLEIKRTESADFNLAADAIRDLTNAQLQMTSTIEKLVTEEIKQSLTLEWHTRILTDVDWFIERHLD